MEVDTPERLALQSVWQPDWSSFPPHHRQGKAWFHTCPASSPPPAAGCRSLLERVLYGQKQRIIITIQPLIYGELDALLLFCCQFDPAVTSAFPTKFLLVRLKQHVKHMFQKWHFGWKWSYFQIYRLFKRIYGWDGGKEAQSYVQLILCPFSLVKINTSLTKLSAYYRAPVSSVSLHTCVSCETWWFCGPDIPGWEHSASSPNAGSPAPRHSPLSLL